MVNSGSGAHFFAAIRRKPPRLGNLYMLRPHHAPPIGNRFS